MTVSDLLKDYANGETDAISAIRALSGIINPDTAVDTLAFINLIARTESGDAEKEDILAILGEAK